MFPAVGGLSCAANGDVQKLLVARQSAGSSVKATVAPGTANFGGNTKTGLTLAVWRAIFLEYIHVLFFLEQQSFLVTRIATRWRQSLLGWRPSLLATIKLSGIMLFLSTFLSLDLPFFVRNSAF